MVEVSKSLWPDRICPLEHPGASVRSEWPGENQPSGAQGVKGTTTYTTHTHTQWFCTHCSFSPHAIPTVFVVFSFPLLLNRRCPFPLRQSTCRMLDRAQLGPVLKPRAHCGHRAWFHHQRGKKTTVEVTRTRMLKSATVNHTIIAWTCYNIELTNVLNPRSVLSCFIV